MQYPAHMWCAAVYGMYAHPKQWQLWADRQLEIGVPKPWIASLSVAHTEADFTRAVLPELAHEDALAGTRLYIGNAKLGYLFWTFCDSRLKLVDFLELAGSECDGGTADLECERVFALLSRIEELDSKGNPRAPVMSIVESMFRPFQLLAAAEWAELQQM